MPLPVVATVVHEEELASTSDEAKRLLIADEVALPLVVTARRQTAGRGRGDHAWWSDEGSLTFTLGLDPSLYGLHEAHLPRVALATAVALIDAIEHGAGVSPGRLGIRWPNDIEADGRKLGGILPERVECRGGQSRLAIGVGLNLTSRLDDAPGPIQGMATTIEALAGRPPDSDAVLRGFLSRMESTLIDLATDDPTLSDRWAALDALQGRHVLVDLGVRIVAGRALGIDRRGALTVETDDGCECLFGGQVLRSP